jgi:transglutaminase-like putative cysteine protease
MRHLIEHATTLEYSEPVREHHLELRLTPRATAYQSVHDIRIEVEPEVLLGGYTDCFGNRVTCGAVIAPHRRLVTRLRAEVENTLANPFDFVPVSPAAEREWLERAIAADLRLYDYLLHRSPATPDLARLEEIEVPVLAPGRSVLEAAREAMAWVAATLRYEPGVTHVHSSLVDALQARAGVCQDFAHLMIAVARSWRVPARYVMGYLAATGEGEDDNEPATHAWAELLVPGAGWLGFDATHQLLANDRFIPVAVGRDYLDAAPQRGSFRGDAAGEHPVVAVAIQSQ